MVIQVKKKIEQINEKEIDLDKQFSLEELIGKRVLGKNGTVIGRVKNIIIKDYMVLGIIIRRLLKKDIFIGRQYFDSFTEKAVILNIEPFMAMIGLQVIDKKGEILGKVVRIGRNTTTNRFSHIYVKRGIISKTIKIDAQDIGKISENIILNKEYGI